MKVKLISFHFASSFEVMASFASCKGSGTAFKASFKGIGAFNSSSFVIVGNTMAIGRRILGISSCIDMGFAEVTVPKGSFRFSYHSMGGALSYSFLQVLKRLLLLEGLNLHLTYFARAETLEVKTVRTLAIAM